MKDLDKINWKLRIKNRAVLVALVSAAMVFATDVAQALGFELPVTTDQVVCAVDSVLVVLCALGIVVDPTTKGIADSSRAMGYAEPHDDAKKVDPESVPEVEEPESGKDGE